MLSKLTKSLAYRLPYLYKKILKFRKFKTTTKPECDLTVITMTGKAHIELTRLSILSIANKWSRLPKLVVYGDGSISEKEIRDNLSFWKGKLEVGEWILAKNYHEAKHRNALLQYAKVEPFGKKMALILFHADQHPLIWIDSDILFFKDFTIYIPAQNLDVQCGGTEDFYQAFDNRIEDALNSNFNSGYKFNAGLLYASGKNIYEHYNLENVLNSIHPSYDFLTEQTIFAHIASHSLGIIWKQDIVKNFHSDNQALKGTDVNVTIARHYVSNVRHLFWRDAFLHFKFLNTA